MASSIKPFAGIQTGLVTVPPVAEQVGALCYRFDGTDLQFLLVTSSQGRWILPKGWPIDGLTSAEVAAAEAWEEAGVRLGITSARPLVTFQSLKRSKRRGTFMTRVAVHTIAVTELADNFPEATKRQRRWVSPQDAARLVCEDGLRIAIEDLVQAVVVNAV